MDKLTLIVFLLTITVGVNVNFLNSSTVENLEIRKQGKTTNPCNDANVVCPTVDGPDSVYIRLPDCDKFCQCSNGVPHLHNCPPGLHFNAVLNVCDWPSNVGCTTGTTTTAPIDICVQANISCPAIDGPHSVYAALPQCTKFCQCSNGSPYLHTCPMGLHFNPVLNVCDWPENAGCTGGTTQSTTTKIPETTTTQATESTISNICLRSNISCPEIDGPDSVYAALPQCTKFCQCSNGSPYLHTCPMGLHFNPVLNVCDWPENAGCTGGTTQSTTTKIPETTTTQATESTTSNICLRSNISCPEVDGPDSVYAALPQCTKFCQCSNGSPYLHTCPMGLHFNPVLNVCDWPENAGCTGGTTQSTTTKIPETTTTQATESTTSNICRQSNISCPAVDGPNSIYGTLPDCTKFCQCSNGESYLHNCPMGLHFNPVLNVCDWPENARCTGGTTTNTAETASTPNLCVQAEISCPEVDGPDSIYAALSDCTKFCQCSNGSPHLHSCPIGLHFNPILNVCDWGENAGCTGGSTQSTSSKSSESFTTTAKTTTTTSETNTTPKTTPQATQNTTPNVCIEANILCSEVDGPHSVYAPLPDCTKFCQCSNGVPYLHECPKGLHFNQVINVCDWPYNAGCTGSTVTTESTSVDNATKPVHETTQHDQQTTTEANIEGPTTEQAEESNEGDQEETTTEGKDENTTSQSEEASEEDQNNTTEGSGDDGSKEVTEQVEDTTVEDLEVTTEGNDEDTSNYPASESSEDNQDTTTAQDDGTDENSSSEVTTGQAEESSEPDQDFTSESNDNNGSEQSTPAQVEESNETTTGDNEDNNEDKETTVAEEIIVTESPVCPIITVTETVTTTVVTTGTDYCLKHNISCPAFDGTDAVYGALPDCTKFCKCSDGVPTLSSCQSGLHFNPLKNVCEMPDDAGCSSRDGTISTVIETTNTCNEKSTTTEQIIDESTEEITTEENISSDSEENTTEYDEYTTEGNNTDEENTVGEEEENTTAAADSDEVENSTAVDEVTTRNDGQTTVCNTVTVTEISNENTTSTEISGTDLCVQNNIRCPAIDGADSVYASLPDCTKFCQCSNGVPYLHNCPANLHFNPSLNVCDHPDNAGCTVENGTNNKPHDSTTIAPIIKESTVCEIITDRTTVEVSSSTIESISVEDSEETEYEDTNTTEQNNAAENTSTTDDATSGEEDNNDTNTTENESEMSTTVGESATTEENIPETDATEKNFSEEDTTENYTTVKESVTTEEDLPGDENAEENQPESDTTEQDTTTRDSVTSAVTEGLTQCQQTALVCPPVDGPDSVYGPGPKCSQFCQCSNGLPYLHDCPPTLHFNPIKNVCDYTEAAGCNDNLTAPPTKGTPKPTIEVTEAPVDSGNTGIAQCQQTGLKCPAIDGPDSVYGPGPKCSQFCQCSNGLPYLHNCPSTLHFNPLLNVCDFSERAGCENSR